MQTNTSTVPSTGSSLEAIPFVSRTGGFSAEDDFASRPRSRPTRRGFLKGTVAVVGGFGLAAMGVFPKARAALAGNYDIYGACPTSISGTCLPGCGPSFASQSYCKTSTNPLTWHKDSLDNSGYYAYKLRPNACTGGWADGWLWANDSSCSGCSNKKWRCHDGYYRYGTGSWQPVICRWCVV